MGVGPRDLVAVVCYAFAALHKKNPPLSFPDTVYCANIGTLPERIASRRSCASRKVGDMMVMRARPLLLRPILRLAGVADKLKFGARLTAKETVVELLTLPLTPLMVTVKVPMAALVLAVKVKVLVLVVVVGLNDAVTPPGRPEAERMTAPLNPLSGVTVMVLPT